MNREAAIREAMTWLGTPYAHAQRCKGAGVDCGQFPLAVFEAAGLIPHHAPEWYPHDWHLHRDEERWLADAERFTVRVDGDPEPGDLVLFRYGRAISHGAIVIKWPLVIHSVVRRGVVLEDAERSQELASRKVGTWRLKEWVTV